MRNPSVQQEFEGLFDLSDPQHRGRQFERVAESLFISLRHQVKRNPRGAKPRQSDLFVNADGYDYLIEVKWMRRSVDSSHVDSLRSRLERLPSDVVGCIFSMSGFTRSAIHEIAQRRQREIIVFGPKEIYALFSGKQQFVRRAFEKRRALRVDGRVEFEEQSKAAAKKPTRFPKPEEVFSFKQGEGSILDCRATQYTPLVFARQYLDIEPVLGRACSLRVVLEAKTVADLRAAFHHLDNVFGLSGEGSFSIQQSGKYWHGVGVEVFLKALSQWGSRYRAAGLKDPHHTEELIYVDKCSSVAIGVSAEQHVLMNPQEISMVHLTILLPGTQVYMVPYQRLISELGAGESFIEHLDESPNERVRLKRAIDVEVVAEMYGGVRMRGARSVTGLVVKNPFYGKQPDFPNAGKVLSSMGMIGASEVLLCELPAWYLEGDSVDRVMLTEIKATSFGDFSAFHPICRWNRLLRKSEGGNHLEDVRRYVKGVAKNERRRSQIARRVQGLPNSGG